MEDDLSQTIQSVRKAVVNNPSLSTIHLNESMSDINSAQARASSISTDSQAISDEIKASLIQIINAPGFLNSA